MPSRRRQIQRWLAMEDVNGDSPAQQESISLWYSADEFANSQYPTGTAISQWTDLSGNGFHATGSGATRPTVLTPGQNGMPGLDFNGTTQFLDLPAGLVTALTGEDVPTLLVVVMDTDNINSTRTIMAVSEATTANNFLRWRAPGSVNAEILEIRRDAATTVSVASDPSVVTTDAAIVAWINTGTQVSIRLNGDNVKTATALNVGTITPTAAAIGVTKVSGGAASFFDGRIYEIQMYIGDIPTLDTLNTLTTNLGAKYDIAVAFP